MRHKVLIALEPLMGNTLLQTVLDIREPMSVTISPETGSMQEIFEDPSVFLTVDENGEAHDPQSQLSQ